MAESTISFYRDSKSFVFLDTVKMLDFLSFSDPECQFAAFAANGGGHE